MFDTQKRFFIVVCRTGEITNGTHYTSVDSARECAAKRAKEYPGLEFYVCSVDSSYIAEDVISTHYC